MHLKKKLLLSIFLLILTLSAVSAQNGTGFSADKSYSWLISKQGLDGSWNGNVFETSLAILALEKAGLPSNAQKAADWLETQKGVDGCFPTGNCRVKETSFALLALNAMGRDTSIIVDWLQEAQTAAASPRKWWLQVATTGSGICEIEYLEGTQPVKTTFTIENNKIPECNNEPWFDLGSGCLTGNPLSRDPSKSLDIDCSQIPSVLALSLIYHSGDSYYILQEEHQSTATIKVDSGCWGMQKKSLCDGEVSLYATWALKEAGEISTPLAWSRVNYQPSVSLESALLYLLGNKDIYLGDLKDSQLTSGNWDNNVYKTAFGVLATSSTPAGESSALTATDWLKSQQRSDGSWNNQVSDTAITLYSAFAGLQISCGDGVCGQGETITGCPVDCASSITGENCLNGQDDDGDSLADCFDPECSTNPACTQQEVCDDFLDNDDDGLADCDDSDCAFNTICGGAGLGENICDDFLDNDDDGLADCDDSDCVSDSACGDLEDCNDGIDNDKDGDVDGDDLDCTGSKKDGGTGFLGWLIIIIIILLIIGGIFYLYKKKPDIFTNLFSGFKKKPKTPPTQPQPFYTQQPVRRPIQQQRQYIPRQPQQYRRPQEDELDKSIREAKKLIGKE